MDPEKMTKVYIEFASDVFRQGILDNQYVQLQQMQDESEPQFVLQTTNLFIEDAEKLLNELRGILDQQEVNFEKLVDPIRKLADSSASVGARRVKNACMDFLNCCEKGSKEDCVVCLKQLRQEYLLVERKLVSLSKLEKQVLAVGGSLPVWLL